MEGGWESNRVTRRRSHGQTHRSLSPVAVYKPVLEYLLKSFPSLEVSTGLQVFFVRPQRPELIPQPSRSIAAVLDPESIARPTIQENLQHVGIQTKLGQLFPHLTRWEITGFRRGDFKAPIISATVYYDLARYLFYTIGDKGSYHHLGIQWEFESWSPLISDPSQWCTRVRFKPRLNMEENDFEDDELDEDERELGSWKNSQLSSVTMEFRSMLHSSEPLSLAEMENRSLRLLAVKGALRSAACPTRGSSMESKPRLFFGWTWCSANF